MNQKTKNQESREQKNQKLPATMKEALKMQKTKSNCLACVKITFSHVKQLKELYTKDFVAFLIWRKPAVYQDPNLFNTFIQKPRTQNTNNSEKRFRDWKLLHTE